MVLGMGKEEEERFIEVIYARYYLPSSCYIACLTIPADRVRCLGPFGILLDCSDKGSTCS